MSNVHQLSCSDLKKKVILSLFGCLQWSLPRWGAPIGVIMWNYKRHHIAGIALVKVLILRYILSCIMHGRTLKIKISNDLALLCLASFYQTLFITFRNPSSHVGCAHVTAELPIWLLSKQIKLPVNH